MFIVGFLLSVNWTEYQFPDANRSLFCFTYL